MTFTPDGSFDSITEAWQFLNERYLPEASSAGSESSDSALTECNFVFRGECGLFPETRSSLGRVLHERLLSELDRRELQRLSSALIWRFGCQDTEDYNLDPISATVLLQHYGFPTNLVDFTGNASVAFAFASASESECGRICVIPRNPDIVLRFWDNPWCDRAQRQAAYGVATTDAIQDLKSNSARQQLGIKWYEFKVPPTERQHLKEKHQQLLDCRSDASAGFLRFHITEFVEGQGKLSPTLTALLLNRIQISTQCFLVKEFLGEAVQLNFRGRDVLRGFNESIEIEQSRKYWSSSYADQSFDRMSDWAWPPAGETKADPRTYHPELYPKSA
jgi:hypothetical protein